MKMKKISTSKTRKTKRKTLEENEEEDVESFIH